jgi:hypothetical protein
MYIYIYWTLVYNIRCNSRPRKWARRQKERNCVLIMAFSISILLYYIKLALRGPAADDDDDDRSNDDDAT